MLKMIRAIMAMYGRKSEYGDHSAEKHVERMFTIMDTV